jgi:hypothetical protein
LKAEYDKLTQEHKQFEAAVEAERDDMKRKYEKEQKKVRDLKAGQPDTTMKNVGKCVEDAYKVIIQKVHEAYERASQVLIEQNKAAASAASAASATSDTFLYLDASNNWVPIQDSLIVGGLSALAQASDRFSYHVGGHTYEARLADGAWIGQCDIVQKNVQYSTERAIKKGQGQASSPPTDVLTEDQKYDILFGDSPVDFDTKWVEDLLEDHSFSDGDCFSEASLELAKLAQLFNTFSNNYKYVNGRKHKTELYVKPVALYNWLKVAQSRGYTSMRLVMHGGNQTCYDGVRDDPLGMDLKYAGMHGQVHGNGFYFGLSDHITHGYNTVGKPGTALMGLVLTNKSIRSDYYGGHGSYHAFEFDYKKQHTTFNLQSHLCPIRSGHNSCIVMHEGALVLILGFVATL